MPSARALIEKLSPTAPDRDVAPLVALFMLESERTPYWFSINHDIRPPKMLACPVHFDWAKKDRVGIKTDFKPRAEEWIISAALHGYTVQRDTASRSDYDLSMSIERARHIAEYAQRPKDESDDDIPF